MLRGIVGKRKQWLIFKNYHKKNNLKIKTFLFGSIKSVY
jgi:hypothetical protein